MLKYKKLGTKFFIRAKKMKNFMKMKEIKQEIFYSYQEKRKKFQIKIIHCAQILKKNLLG